MADHGRVERAGVQCGMASAFPEPPSPRLPLECLSELQEGWSEVAPKVSMYGVEHRRTCSHPCLNLPSGLVPRDFSLSSILQDPVGIGVSSVGG